MAKHNATGAMKEVVNQNQKALEWAALVLENEAEAKRGFGGKTTSDYAKRLRATAKRLRQIAEPRWIPVSERLPEDETPVLVYCIPRDDDGTPSCAGCDGHGGIISTAWYERLGDGDGEHWAIDGPAPPLFWMPLPEPPAHGEATG